MTQKRSGGTSSSPDGVVELSAGGAVVHDSKVIVVVPVKRDARGRRVLVLPKGHLDAGETDELAAIREVMEETGVTAALIDKLGDVEYSYERRGRRRDKRVAFYLFEYRSGSLEDHDHEIEEARWMPLKEAAEALTYPGEREMVRRALSRSATDR
ncbi:MAG: NUDIX domain-containing protein [Solirubrobacterales bacterium]|nr:NUDIX domain-containing protein [Solirubrobacterales bacterium]MBV9809418.1 NUDIX domain-containing protein [Solirubrobacterales bacterium]